MQAQRGYGNDEGHGGVEVDAYHGIVNRHDLVEQQGSRSVDMHVVGGANRNWQQLPVHAPNHPEHKQYALPDQWEQDRLC